MTYPEEPVDIPNERAPRERHGRVTLIVSSSVLAAISGGLGGLGVSRFGGVDDTRENLLAARLKADVLDAVASKYHSKDLAEERWARLSQSLTDQLSSIRIELSALRQQIERERR